MLILRNLKLYFFDHFRPYPRDEEKNSVQKKLSPQFSQPQSSQKQNGLPGPDPGSCRLSDAPTGQTSPGPAGSCLGLPSSQTQKASTVVVCPGGLFVGHPRLGFFSPLGRPYWTAGPMHIEQKRNVRAYELTSCVLSSVGSAISLVLSGDNTSL